MTRSAPTSGMQDVIDRQAIGDVLSTYCKRLDEYDIDGVGEVFSDQAVMDQGPGRGGPVRGRASIVAGMKQRQARFRRTSHQLGQSMVDITGDTARALTYVIAWHQTWDGEARTARLRYRDTLVRTRDGRWHIAERVSEAMGVEGFDEAQWNWVIRKLPADR